MKTTVLWHIMRGETLPLVMQEFGFGWRRISWLRNLRELFNCNSISYLQLFLFNSSPLLTTLLVILGTTIHTFRYSSYILQTGFSFNFFLFFGFPLLSSLNHNSEVCVLLVELVFLLISPIIFSPRLLLWILLHLLYVHNVLLILGIS